MKKLLRFTLAAGFLAVIAAAFYFVRIDKYRAFPAPVFIDIPRGTSTLRIGDMLTEAGVIRHPFLFAIARYSRPQAKSQAGEYRFESPATPAEVFDRIARGEVYLVELRVPEGSDVFDIGRLVEKAGFASSAEFVKIALPQEGFLFPSTYHFRRKADSETIARAMRAQFEKIWDELGAPQSQQKSLVTLASLVETEAKLEAERARIAGVYRNRLDLGMKLECDPTVEYAAKLDGHWRGTIHKSDLESANRYNTYQYSGLPPGPVANPGRASLVAALHPAETKDLYFVARPDRSGGHVFSSDYSGHQKAVAVYRNGKQPDRTKSTSHRVAQKPARGKRR